MVRAWCALYILTSKCASRHDGVHFFDIELPKVVRTWCATWKCTSRYNGVHFFISHLASWLRTRRFSDKSFATLLPFRAPGSSFFWLFLFLLLFSSPALPISAFSSVHIVGSYLYLYICIYICIIFIFISIYLSLSVLWLLHIACENGVHPGLPLREMSVPSGGKLCMDCWQSQHVWLLLRQAYLSKKGCRYTKCISSYRHIYIYIYYFKL